MIRKKYGGNYVAKRKNYDENGNQVRSRTTKRLHKRGSMWALVLVVVLLGVVGVYAISQKSTTTETASENTQVVTEETKKEAAEVKETVQEETKEKASTYTYEDFKGTYVQFSGEPYNSPIQLMDYIAVIGDEDYRIFDHWEVDETSTITSKSLSGNTLTLHTRSAANEMLGTPAENRTEQFKLSDDGHQKVLYSVTNNKTLYAMSKEDLQKHYKQSEIDYARIMMTLGGAEGLDMWVSIASEGYEQNTEKANVYIGYSKKNQSSPGRSVVYPEDVTHLYLVGDDSDVKVSYTYAPLDAGYIRVYSEDASKSKVHYIKPFEPYEVAIFIGNVAFLNEASE